MSEHYIQSQFLIKQITDDFFKEKSSNIRIKNQDYEMKDDDVDSLISDISDESDLVKMDSPVLNDQYHYLENNNDLHKLFDFCHYNEDILQELKIYLCCYSVNNETILPFLQFLLIENNGSFTFPSFPFKCATNIPENEDGEIIVRGFTTEWRCGGPFLIAQIKKSTDLKTPTYSKNMTTT